MIRFTLACAENHSFDSWFASDAGFESLAKAGQLACPVCGSTSVAKSLMAPAVRPARTAAAVAAQGAPARPLSTPQTEVETALSEMRRQVEANSDYVGLNFVAEARAMHAGQTPERTIHVIESEMG